MGSLSRDILKLHKDLRKIESVLITQIRIKYIELAVFLNKAGMPGYKTPTYQCGQAREMAAHVIMHCPRFAEIRYLLEDPATGQLDLLALINMPAGA